MIQCNERQIPKAANDAIAKMFLSPGMTHLLRVIESQIAAGQAKASEAIIKHVGHFYDTDSTKPLPPGPHIRHAKEAAELAIVLRVLNEYASGQRELSTCDLIIPIQQFNAAETPIE